MSTPSVPAHLDVDDYEASTCASCHERRQTNALGICQQCTEFPYVCTDCKNRVRAVHDDGRCGDCHDEHEKSSQPHDGTCTICGAPTHKRLCDACDGVSHT